VNAMRLEGDAAAWPEQLARITELGFTTILVGPPEADPIAGIRRLGEETAPRLRELVGV